MVRLSVAVRLPPEVTALLANLERPALPGVRWSGPERWLVKLRPLGRVADRSSPGAVRLGEPATFPLEERDRVGKAPDRVGHMIGSAVPAAHHDGVG
jgi:hypothetical protein